MNGTKAVLLFIGITLLFLSTIFVTRWVMAPATGSLEKREQVYSSHSQIVNYEHFFDLCSSIQAFEISLKAQQEQLEVTKDTQERQRILTNIAGLKAQRGSAIMQYNVDARKNETRAKFKDAGLPKRINPNAKETLCE